MGQHTHFLCARDRVQPPLARAQRRLVTIFVDYTFNYRAPCIVFADSAGWPGLRGRILQPMANAL